jgi:uncharacterized protein YecT (DUF1311 family)
MKRVFLVLLFFSISVFASGSDMKAPDAATIMADLSQRTGIPEDILAASLSNCDANQLNMNLCAQRDFVSADLSLKQLLRDKSDLYPTCMSSLQNRIARFEENRARGCGRSAKKNYNNGSMQPMAQSLCATNETKKMIKKLNDFHGCRAR